MPKSGPDSCRNWKCLHDQIGTAAILELLFELHIHLSRHVVVFSVVYVVVRF